MVMICDLVGGLCWFWWVRDVVIISGVFLLLRFSEVWWDWCVVLVVCFCCLWVGVLSWCFWLWCGVVCLGAWLFVLVLSFMVV